MRTRVAAYFLAGAVILSGLLIATGAERPLVMKARSMAFHFHRGSRPWKGVDYDLAPGTDCVLVKQPDLLDRIAMKAGDLFR